MTRHQTSGRSGLGFLLASITTLMWGVLPLALKVTLVSMDAYTITWYRFLIAVLLLGGALAYGRKLPSLGPLPRSVWGLLVIATLFLAANYICYLLGLHHTTPTNTQVLIQLAPPLLALGGIWIFDERFNRLQWFGFGLLLAGLAAFVQDQLRFPTGNVSEYYLGSFLMCVAAGTWAIYGLAQKQLLQWLPSQGILVCIYLGCVVLFTPFSTPHQVWDMNRLQFGMLLFCSLNTIVAYGTFSEALVHWEASRVGALLALTPLVTIGVGAVTRTFWPNVIPSATLSGVGVLGASLVIVGSLLTALGQRGPSQPTAGHTDPH